MIASDLSHLIGDLFLGLFLPGALSPKYIFFAQFYIIFSSDNLARSTLLFLWISFSKDLVVIQTFCLYREMFTNCYIE